jgi:Flp pilus assembly pilin Flp
MGETGMTDYQGEAGQDTAEYALLLGFLAVVLATGVVVFGAALAAAWNFLVAQFGAIF